MGRQRHIISRIELAKQAVLASGKEILTMNPEEGVHSKEGNTNFVTAGDKASEKVIIGNIKKYYPNDQILSEETESDLTELLKVGHLWVIDPIDGTFNYLNHLNYSAISVGYVETGVLKTAAVYDPFRKDLFTAEKNKGAFVNGNKIRVSTKSDFSSATVAADSYFKPEITRNNLRTLLKLDPVPWILMKGSVVMAVCEVACGRIDLYFQTGVKPWDNAAAMLILSEAGGIVRNLKGEKTNFLSNTIVAGNKILVSKFIRMIK